MSFSKNHQVTAIIYYQCKSFIDDSIILKRMQRQYSLTLYNSINIRNRYKRIAEALTSADVSFIQVKGLHIATLYPVPELRTMGDIDLLVHQEDFEKVADIFLGFGFQYGKKTEHEITFYNNSLYYEIHELMINDPMAPDELRKKFYNDYWNHLDVGYSLKKGGEKVLDWSFYFLFLLQHMRQHILWEGIGFRQFMDLAIVINNVLLDWKYIVDSCRKIELYDFLTKVLAFLHRWFGTSFPLENFSAKESFELEEDFYEYVTDKIFSDGIFGFANKDNRINTLERDYRLSGLPLFFFKCKQIAGILFPSYKKLYQVQHYAFLKGRPYLLPVTWIYRVFYAMKHGKYASVKEIKNISKADSKRLNTRRRDIKMWGL